MTRAPCRRRTGDAVPRTEIFGDYSRSQNLGEGCDARNNHKFAVEIGFSLLRAKKKTSQETEKSLRKFLEPSEKPKVIYIHNSSEFGKSCEELSWNHRTSTRRRMVLLKSGTQNKRSDVCCSVSIWLQ